MKKWILLIWLFCVQLLAVHAENEYYTIFKVGSNICTPVTLKTPYGTYSGAYPFTFRQLIRV